MKKLLLFFIAITWPVFFLSAQSQTPSSTSNEIELEKTPITIGPYDTGFPRSIYFLEAYYDSQTGVVEIVYDGLADTIILIFDEKGEIAYRDVFYSSNNDISTITIPSLHGTYTIIIDSTVVYAYGHFGA